MRLQRFQSLALAGAAAILPVQALAQAVVQPAPAPVRVQPTPPQVRPQAAPAPAKDPIAPLPAPADQPAVVEQLPPPIWQVADAQELLT